MSDDDIAFHSDITYMRALLSDISEKVHEVRHANPMPIDFSANLEWATREMAAIKKLFTDNCRRTRMLLDWQGGRRA